MVDNATKSKLCLPDGWLQVTDEWRLMTYYVNHSLQQTRWTPPEGSEWPPAEPLPPKDRDTVLHYKWEERLMPSGLVLYISLETGYWQWDRPALDWEQLDVTFAALIDQGEEGSLLDILNKYVGLPDVWKRLARLAVTVGVKLGKAAFVQLLVDQGAVDAEFLASEWLADKVAFDNNMDMIATFLKAGLVFEGAHCQQVLMLAMSYNKTSILEDLLFEGTSVDRLMESEASRFSTALALLLYRSKAALILRYILKLVRKDRSFLATFEDPATTHSVQDPSQRVGPIHLAMLLPSPDVLLELIELGANISSSWTGKPIVYEAALHGSPECLKVLLDKLLDPNDDAACAHVLTGAFAGLNVENILLLLQHNSKIGSGDLVTFVQNSENYTSGRNNFSGPSLTGHKEKMTKSRAASPESIRSAMKVALGRHMPSPTLEPLLDADISLAGLLDVAIKSYSSYGRDSTEIAKHFLSRGADPNMIVSESLTTFPNMPIISLAAQVGTIRVVNELVQHGANINQADANGWTPAHFAAFYGNIGILKQLLVAGANVYAKTHQNPKNMTVLSAAERKNARIANIVRRFIHNPGAMVFDIETYDESRDPDTEPFIPDMDVANSAKDSSSSNSEIKCVSCEVCLDDDPQQLALLPCFHPICVQCADEDDEVKCPWTVTGDELGEAAVGLVCGTPFSRANVVFPSAFAESKPKQDEEGNASEQDEEIVYRCRNPRCNALLTFAAGPAHNAKTLGQCVFSIVPADNDVKMPCMRAGCGNPTGIRFCGLCTMILCHECSRQEVPSHRKSHADLATGFLSIVKRLQSTDAPTRFKVRQEGQMLAALSAALLQRRIEFVRLIGVHSASISPEQLKDLDAQLLSVLSAQAKQVEIAHDTLIIQSDSLLAAKELVLDESKPIRLRLSAFVRVVGLLAQVPTVPSSPIDTTPALRVRMLDGDKPTVSIVQDRVYSPMLTLGPSSDKRNFVHHMQFHIGRDYSTVQEATTIIAGWPAERKDDLILFDSDGRLLNVSCCARVAFVVREIDMDKGRIARTIVVDNSTVTETIVTQAQAGPDGTIWLLVNNTDWQPQPLLYRLCMRTGVLLQQIDLRAALSLQPDERVACFAVLCDDVGTLVCLLAKRTQLQPTRRFVRWPIAALNPTDGSLLEHWLCEEIDVTDKTHPLFTYVKQVHVNPICLATPDFVLIAAGSYNCKFSTQNGAYVRFNESTGHHLCPQKHSSACAGYDPASDLILYGGCDLIAVTTHANDRLSKCVASFVGGRAGASTEQYNTSLATWMTTNTVVRKIAVSPKRIAALVSSLDEPLTLLVF